jgi:hypothetical protein
MRLPHDSVAWTIITGFALTVVLVLLLRVVVRLTAG